MKRHQLAAFIKSELEENRGARIDFLLLDGVERIKSFEKETVSALEDAFSKDLDRHQKSTIRSVFIRGSEKDVIRVCNHIDFFTRGPDEKYTSSIRIQISRWVGKGMCDTFASTTAERVGAGLGIIALVALVGERTHFSTLVRDHPEAISFFARNHQRVAEIKKIIKDRALDIRKPEDIEMIQSILASPSLAVSEGTL